MQELSIASGCTTAVTTKLQGLAAGNPLSGAAASSAGMR